MHVLLINCARFWGTFLGGAIINSGCGFQFFVHIAFVPEAWQKNLEPMGYTVLVLDSVLLYFACSSGHPFAAAKLRVFKVFSKNITRPSSRIKQYMNHN